ncbi:hypothetical protein RND71_025033 [Anisodus tanguticus]|uniref:Uncharacterized protein n=1 Tax=Anisodus tanguticus TaxID=243964 RepID=A0AAE1V5F5_9SOLA|nr:hypothetical protein RND71_025033 [Anisodus tanguticus]
MKGLFSLSCGFNWNGGFIGRGPGKVLASRVNVDQGKSVKEESEPSTRLSRLKAAATCLSESKKTKSPRKGAS